ncbi:MAG: FtsX-like permease family protein [Proteobacteria bacterium]|nr:FtsX-like permease family protein [Pseudomonadota bacterium]
MPLLWAASIRHLLRHPAQLILALVGLSVGVGTIIAVDIATASSGRAFQLSMQAVNGTASHAIVGGPQGLDEQLYVDLRRTLTTLSPVVEGYVVVGERTMQLVGIDPLAGLDAARRAGAGTSSTAGAGVGWVPGAGAGWTGGGASWFVQPGAVVMAARTAEQLGLRVNDRFSIAVGGRSHSAVLIGTITGDQAGYDALVLTDIAQAQEWLESVGKLSRIDVALPEGASAADLASRLPPGVRLEKAQGRAQQTVDMTAAFTTNLQAMSLLALMVSTLLIYGAISFAVVQRRRIIGILRALGATRGNVFTIVLTEAAVLGVVGASLGLLLGAVIGRGLVHLVSQTINDLYFVVAVNETVLPPASVVKALLAGFGTALAGAWLPALEVAASAPQLGLRRSVLEARAVALARRLLFASGGLAVASGLVAGLSGRSLFAGFAALFLLLLSAATLTPAVLRMLAQACARFAGRISPVARLVFGDVAASLSRTGVAVAALGMALAAMIGVSIMVESFRESLRDWLGQTLRADIYVTAPGPGAGRPERRIDSGLVASMIATHGVVDYGMSRRVTVELAQGPVPLDAVQFAHNDYITESLVAGDPAVTWPAFEKGAIVISDPLAYRSQLHVGDSLTLPTASGPRPFRIAGIYREYGNDRGTIRINLPVYRRLWHDDGITAMGFYLAPGTSLVDVVAGFRAAARGKQSLLIRSNADLRNLSMSIFERTFVITRVLYWLAAGVAAIGLVSALLAWELERAHEIAILRSLGLTPGGAGLLIEGQTGFMGLVALVAAIPAGLLTAVLLIDVINRRAFGWRIDVHLSVAQFGNALLLALVAALVAGLYPARRVAVATIAADIREE